jgi:tetratricopeptide (TPR) repeat protein
MPIRTLVACSFVATLAACGAPRDPIIHSDDYGGSGYPITVAASVLRQGNFVQAISLADAAIASNELDVHDQKFAHGVRAAASLHAGQYDRAAQDLAFIAQLEPSATRDVAAGYAAVAAHPDRAWSYFALAKLYLAAAQYPEAIANCDIAIGFEVAAVRIPARDRAAWSRFNTGRFQEVIDDIGDNYSKIEAQPYTIMLLHLARAKLGRNDDRELGLAVDAVGPGEWPAPVLAFYLGRVNRDQLFDAADEGPDYKTREGQRCEANFYAGEQAALSGKTADARNLLETAQRNCPAHFSEAAAATAELGRLNPR